MAEIVRILRDEGYDGVLVPDHVPDLHCPAPWHAGHAYTVGYMRALVKNADALGPSVDRNDARHAKESSGGLTAVRAAAGEPRRDREDRR